MAENQEYEMGNCEYQQDGGEHKFQLDQQQVKREESTNEAGDGGDQPMDSDNAKAPGTDERKLFVGGLSWETTDKELVQHFQTYGEIVSVDVKIDKDTGRPRGFAFILFSQAESVDKVLSAGDHIIHNKKVDPKKAKANARPGKIFVGGLGPELSDTDIRNYFAQYGTIVEVEMPFDKTKNQRKGFCFIKFDSDQVVRQLLKFPKQTINGKQVHIKKATPKPVGMGGVHGGRGGHGSGRGGYGSQYWGNQGGYGGYGGHGGYGYYGGYNQEGYGGSTGGGKDKFGVRQTYQPY